MLRFAWAISAETVLRSAFNSSTVTKISRRFASNFLMFSKLSAVTPRVVNLEATPSKSVRIRFISNITMDTQSRVATSQSRKLLESLDFLGGFLL